MQVGYNLWEAFQQLRYPDRCRKIWIDAICIDQNDLIERNEQVQFMDCIYRQAASVVVWLGAAGYNSPAAFRLIRQIHAVAESALPEDSKKPLTEAEIEKLGLPNQSTSDWQALDSIFWRPWFRRVWIIQEMAAARSAVVICGEDSLPWDTLAAVTDFIHYRELWKLRDVNAMALIHLLDLRNHYIRHEKLDLLPLLVAFRESLATNPRDKVYALLNIASTAGIIPDYRVSTVDVFREVCTKYLRHSLDILSLCGDHRWKQIKGLPSWVPDWSSTLLDPQFLFREAKLPFNACGATSPLVRFSKDGSRVFIHGRLLDRVEARGHPLIYAHGYPLRQQRLKFPQTWSLGKSMIDDSSLHTVALTIRHWERMILRLKRYPTDEDIHTVLYKTLIANSNLGTHPSSKALDLEEMYSSFRKHLALLPPWARSAVNTGQCNREDARAYYVALMSAAYGKRVFVSRGGYVGLCPFSTRRNDCVVVFHGGKTAYVLREVRAKTSKNFIFIGEAYLHGFMNGEAFESHSTTTDEEFGII